jgi:DNA polymerase III epsilon subunit-like protein
MRNLRVTKPKINIDDIKDKFFVFDTETTSLEPQPKNFVFGVIYGWNFYKVIKSVEDFKREFELTKYNKKYIFAHNAEFDLLTIFGNIIMNIDAGAVFNGKFIMAKYNGITFADSMNI